MKPLHENPYYAVAVALLFTSAVFLPTVLGWPDSFPLSTYPMFAKHRGEPEMVKLVAVTAQGKLPVPPRMLGTNEVLQAKVLLEQVAAKRQKHRDRFCAQTAGQLATLPETTTWQEIELVRVKYDPLTYFEKNGSPIAEKLLARCAVHHEASPPTPAQEAPKQDEQAP